MLSSDARSVGLHRGSTAVRVFYALAGVACLGLAVAAVLAIAAGGYRPERYVGGFDPVRTAMLISFAAGAAAFLLVVGAGFGARLSGDESIAFNGLVFWAGLAVSDFTILVVLAWMAPSSAPQVVPIPLRVGVFIGLGLVVAGMVPWALRGATAGVRRRDPRLLVALLLLVLLVVLRFAWHA